MLNSPSDWIELGIEIQIHVFTESTAVIVAMGSAITERFQNHIGVEENITDSKIYEITMEEIRAFTTVEFHSDSMDW